MDNGWVKTHRKLIEWEWYDDSKIVHLYLHCLLKANHKPNKWRGIVIESGQFVTSYNKLSCELPMSVQQIRTSLNKLKSTSEITIKSTSKYSIISITNWDSYQQDNKPANKQVTSKQQTDNKQITTNKNEKNDKKLKEYIYTQLMPWPIGFHITDKLRSWANEKKHTHLEEHFENFKCQCEAKGYKYKNWNSAFQTAIRNDWAKINKDKQHEENKRSSTPKAKQFSDKLDEIARRDIEENGWPSDTTSVDNSAI